MSRFLCTHSSKSTVAFKLQLEKAPIFPSTFFGDFIIGQVLRTCSPIDQEHSRIAVQEFQTCSIFCSNINKLPETNAGLHITNHHMHKLLCDIHGYPGHLSHG